MRGDSDGFGAALVALFIIGAVLWALRWFILAALAVGGRVFRGPPAAGPRVDPRLVPAQGSPLADLISSGQHPATLTGPLPRPGGPVQTDREAGELLRELRDAERY